MSDLFDDREKGYEAKFARDQEAGFKINARRAKMMGQWAAGLAGLGDEASAALAMAALEAHLEGGEKALFGLIRERLDGAGVDRSDHQIEREMADLLAEAERQIRG